tara:strand:+ start:391 stop:768 length:378 start_codon:yes stop_codon:yes gene_type:complete
MKNPNNNIIRTLTNVKNFLLDKIKNNLHIFYQNKLIPFKTFFLNLPGSLKKTIYELEELHEIELYDRLFVIKKSERELIKMNNSSDKILSRFSNYFFGLTNRLKIILNKKILQIFYSKSNPLRLK